ncbi:alpha/beta fold hydrolase [Desulfoluna spongiiphila]|uniref:Alpha/beta hydrolase family protein n=1 Tax=Desulfoluna spongiiphila TaxID=419481 RepID=A0A1G5ASN7_9BACT|nr:hypothetical protein [Desulfoluna spongiiphila]SCX80913.1 hypothetical protein SAMN05216233_101426 [Desulfoluna spongiiphila]
MKPITIPITRTSSDIPSIPGTLYGTGKSAVIFSNMDTNDQQEWNPVVKALVPGPCMVVTYDYPGFSIDQSEILEEVVSCVAGMGAERIILIGASRGGVASLKVASRRVHDDRIVAVAALSAPIEHEGSVFYTDDELREISVPKLLINSEEDDGAEDNRKMLSLFCEPKKLLFYSGDGHGAEIFDGHEEAVVEALLDFINRSFSRETA